MSDDKPDKRQDMPPVPRDYAEASASELMPLKSSNINIWKSPILYMVLLTVAATMAMFKVRIMPN